MPARNRANSACPTPPRTPPRDRSGFALSAFARAALDAVPAHLAVVNARGEIVAVNRAWRAFARENGGGSCVGLNYLAVCDRATGEGSEQAAATARALRAVLSGKSSGEIIEYPCHTPGWPERAPAQACRWFQARITPMRHAGRRLALIAHESITEARLEQHRLRAQLDRLAQQQRFTLLAELSATLAHELNQPLAAIGAYAAGAVRSREDAERVRFALERIQAESSRASAIVQRLRGFAGRSSASNESATLDQCVRESLALIEPLAASRGVRLVRRVSNPQSSIAADAVRVRQVLVNLLRNAIEAASGRRGARVEVKARVVREKAILRVRDNGPGLAPEVRSHLFEPMTTTKPDGLGMGLALSRSIAESHGGTLEPERTTAGTSFRLTLPAARPRGTPSTTLRLTFSPATRRRAA
ncbi:MAG: ATP-binding protein [Planctomycetota bacterium]|nr:ATP-binding protein [Planctomycetota bacterium]